MIVRWILLRKVALSLFVLMGFTINTMGEIDSLLLKLTQLNIGIEKIELLLKISNEKMVKDPLSALYDVDEALALSKEIKNDSCVALAYKQYGKLHRLYGNYFVAASYYFKVLEFDKHLTPINKGNILNSIGICYQSMKNDTLAVKYFQKAYIIFDSIDYKIGLANVNNNSGNIFYSKKEYEVSLKYYLQSLEFYLKFNDKEGTAIAYNNIGNIYNRLLERKLALDYYYKGLDYALGIENKYAITLLYVNIGNAFLNDNNAIEGIKYLEEGIKMGIKYGYKDLVISGADFLEYQYAKRKMYDKTYKYILLRDSYIDSVYNEENTRRLIELDFKYEYEKRLKEQKIERLERDKKIKVQWILLISGFIIALLLFSLTYYMLRNRLLLERTKKIILMTKFESIEFETKKELQFKNSAIEKLALHIQQNNNFTDNLKMMINDCKKEMKNSENLSKLNKVYQYICQNKNYENEMKTFQLYIEKSSNDFLYKIKERYPNLTETEKRLIVLLRLNFSTKEIATLCNISGKSIEVYRSNLRKKLEIPKNDNIYEFLSRF